MKNKSEIRLENKDDICYVYVLDSSGKECFRREKTEQTIAIAHTIYMYERYHLQNEKEKRVIL